MTNESYKISLFGLGHIGLPTASLLANEGIKVIGVDINPEVIDLINSGYSPIFEPGLNELVNKAVKEGFLSATLDGVLAARNSNVMIVVVPTPVDENKSSDLSTVISACNSISQGLKKDDLVIIESTLPPHACERTVIPILEESGLRASEDFGVVHTPERAIPNNTIYEITHNPRVIGGIDEKSSNKAAFIYKRINKGEIIILRDLATAEMVKLMENTYRDTNIALANELALICDSLGIDAIDAINAANFHPRVNIHTPGPGVGGHCLSIDPYFIVEMAEEQGTPARLIKTARNINEKMPLQVAKMVDAILKEGGKSINNSTVGLLGVAYKGNVADIRETPAQILITDLVYRGADVLANDPYVNPDLITAMGAKPVEMKDALNCDCVVLLTDHDQYLHITPKMIKNSLFVCTRPILEPGEFRKQGVIFRGVGRSFDIKEL